MSARRIEVQIGRLVLDGFDAGDGHAIAGAISHALTRRFAEHAELPSACESIGPIDVGAPSMPVRIASAIAGSLAGGDR